MRFITTPKSTASCFITNKGTYVNKHGRVTNHARGAKTHKPIDFIGVDGEGMMVNGEHKYVLFGVGEDQIENPNGLEWNEVFEFLYKHYQPSTAFVGFFLGYDFAQILKTLPEDRAYMLITKEGRELRQRHRKNPSLRWTGQAPHPVEHKGWHFDMLAMKRLRIRPKTCECPYPSCKCTHAPWLYLCDVGGFFQSSFLTVIDPKNWAEGTQIVTDEEFAIIKEGKGKRSTAVLDEDMRRYNVLENKVLARVMRTLDTGFQAIGINLPPSKWFGPGQAAQTWLKNEKVPENIDLFGGTRPDREREWTQIIPGVVPAWFSEAARMSYFGGWFELFMHGHVPGITHEYDINSAYPSVIATLPCLLHGEYSFGNGIPTVKDGDLCLVYGDVRAKEEGKNPGAEKRQHIGSMLHRAEDGSISRPMGTIGWFWWDELKAAEKAKLVKRIDNRGGRVEWSGPHQKIERWVKYEPCDCPPPMGAIRDLYQKRLQVGKKSVLGKAAKLVYNSAYGKFAQSVGSPIFGNPIYASRITSGCRKMILNAIATHPNGKADVAMIATDGVYFLTEHPSLPLSSELGEWDHQTKSNLTLFKPGVYWDDKAREAIAAGKSPHFKARGFKADDFIAQISRIDSEFAAWPETAPKAHIYAFMGGDPYTKGWPVVTFTPSFAMITALQALRRNKWELAGAVAEIPDELKQSSNPYQKRWNLNHEEYEGRIIYRSQPLAIYHQESLPYEKRFGIEDPLSEESRELLTQMTPDGDLGDIMAWILKGE